MEFNFLIVLVIIGLLLILALFFAIKIFLRNMQIKKLGLKGEKKVAKILKRYAFPRGFKVINDIYLPLYDQTTQIDHILIGFFGMLVIETKNYKGQVYGNPSEKEWTHIVSNQKNKFYNPIMQNHSHIENIRYIFNKEKIYNIDIDSLIVFADKKIILNVPKNLPIVRINKLKKMLKKSKYTEDKGIDVNKLYNAIMKNQVTDKNLIKKHDKNVKRISK